MSSNLSASQNASRLALGTVQFGLAYGIANKDGQVSPATAKEMVGFAHGAGIDTLDTAIGYGNSEEVLGQIGVQTLKVISKLPALSPQASDVGGWVQEQVRLSLARLKLDTMHGLLLHRPMELLGENGASLYQALQMLKENGVIQKLGVSVYSPEELSQLTAKYSFDIIQAPFNLVDRRLATSGWLQRLKEQGTEVHIRSAFLQGLLLMPRTEIPARFNQWSALWNAWHQWLEHQHTNALGACLAFALSFPEIDRVVVGANDLQQLQQIIKAANETPNSALPNLACEDEKLINPATWSTA
jgi:aryl-alcohol dehydrogenase-like predicted oxidoreductase